VPPKTVTKPSTPPVVKKSAIEEFPDFTKDTLELLGKLPANDFIDSVLAILKEDVTAEKFEEEVIDVMELLETPAPEEVVDFLFDGIENEEFFHDDSYAIAIQTLFSIIDKKDEIRLIKAIVGYLRNKLENESQRKVLDTLHDLANELI